MTGVVRSVAEARALGGGRRACFSPFLPSQLQAQAVGPERPEQGSGVSGLSRGQSRAQGEVGNCRAGNAAKTSCLAF